jgi:agmatinase
MKFEYLTPIRPGFGGFDEPYERAKIVFAGIPLDLTSSYRPGTRFAPSSLREASANLETYQPSMGLDVFERLNISDVGDLMLVPADLQQSGERITQLVKELLKDGKTPALLGGEHTLTYFSIKAMDDITLIQLDAHRDLREEYLGDRVCHASVMRRVLDSLPPERLIQVGIRSCSKEEADFASGKEIHAYTAEAVLRDMKGVLNEIKELAKGKVYLSLDLDVLDPAFAPAVATPEPGGLSTLDVLRLVRELGRLDIRAFDVVELAPPYDSGITAFAGARIIYELLAALAAR